MEFAGPLDPLGQPCHEIGRAHQHGAVLPTAQTPVGSHEAFEGCDIAGHGIHGAVDVEIRRLGVHQRELQHPRRMLPEAGQRVGLVIMATILGMALGGWLSGWIYDLTGSYQAAFLNGIAWNFLNMAVMIFIFMRGKMRPTGAAA